MTTQTLPTAARPADRGAASLTNRIGRRLRALVAALAAWRHRRALERRTFRASHELAGLSSHVLRDIGARDVDVARASAFDSPRTSVLDLEIRG
jgi:uncharacterized protein YjiS (DUF1127 family)